MINLVLHRTLVFSALFICFASTAVLCQSQSVPLQNPVGDLGQIRGGQYCTTDPLYSTCPDIPNGSMCFDHHCAETQPGIYECQTDSTTFKSGDRYSDSGCPTASAGLTDCGGASIICKTLEPCLEGTNCKFHREDDNEIHARCAGGSRIPSDEHSYYEATGDPCRLYGMNESRLSPKLQAILALNGAGFLPFGR